MMNLIIYLHLSEDHYQIRNSAYNNIARGAADEAADEVADEQPNTEPEEEGEWWRGIGVNWCELVKE